MTKAEIRKRIKAKRDKLKFEQKKKMDQKICDKLHKSKYWKQARTILIYVSHKNEVDTNHLILMYINEKHIIVPKTNPKNHTLTLHKINSLDDLEEKNYGILEPKPKTKKIKPDQIDLAIIPGIAFDKKGHRIGFGKAYYDRLNKNLKCPKLGLAYGFQIIDNIPAQSHDIPLDLILTEEKTIKITT
ncbi:5-formyltetrahydrofolate cyclo-ligase [Patescibacteria group bacterium]